MASRKRIPTLPVIAPVPLGAAAQRLPMQALEFAFAVPQVMANRLTRLALAGPSPSARDRREFRQMGAEKPVVFAESWIAMCTQVWLSQQALATALLRHFWMPWQYGHPLAPGRASRTATQDTFKLMARGLGPFHRRATANARRLTREGRSG